tara:strand:+ start:1208 stop:1909 length:702 start_codon:yes stop_codon:yes gene_type:complete
MSAFQHQLSKMNPLKLKVFVDDTEQQGLTEKYKEYIEKHNYKLVLGDHPDSGFDLFAPVDKTLSAGDLSTMIDLNISAALYEEDITYPHAYSTIGISAGSSLVLLFFMNASIYMYMLLGLLASGLMWLLDDDQYTIIIKERPIPFKLYPRSSMGSKTPLRLGNSVGVVDSGYRGHLMACVDCHGEDDYSITQYDRLLQIVAFSGRPIFVKLVENHNDLGETIRGDGGFGSTGK